MDRGAWRATIYGVKKNWTRQKRLSSAPRSAVVKGREWVWRGKWKTANLAVGIPIFRNAGLPTEQKQALKRLRQ